MKRQHLSALGEKRPVSRSLQPIPIISDDRARMLVQIDALEQNGAPIEEVEHLRSGVLALRMPDDMVQPLPITHADAVLGAAQLKTLVQLWADRMPTESGDLLLRIATSLAGAR